MMSRYRFGPGEHMNSPLPILVLIEGLCPSNSPTPSLARAFALASAPAARSRRSLAGADVARDRPVQRLRSFMR
jgi:hypothetical protein